MLPSVYTRVPRYVHEKGTSKRAWVMNMAAEGYLLLKHLVLWFSQSSNILAYEYKRRMVCSCAGQLKSTS